MDTEEKPAKPEAAQSEAAQPAAPGLKVVESYTPRLRSGAEGAGQTMIDPLTKRVIPVEQANEHMRIELMDPMWKKQNAVRHERDATTNLASGAEMSDTIHRMRASQEKELGLKRAQPAAQEASAQEIDEQLKRQRMRAMGIPPPPPVSAQAVSAVPPAVSAMSAAPVVAAAPAAVPAAAPKPPMAGMPMPPPRAPVPGMPGMPMSMPNMPMPAMPMPGMPMPMPNMPAMPAMPNMPAMPMPTMGGTGENWVGW